MGKSSEIPDDMKYLEIEHKFMVGAGFDALAFHALAMSLNPTENFSVQVSDRYFILDGNPDAVFRHRSDERLQHLSVKSRGGGDSAVRKEINLLLDRSEGSQVQAVQEFFKLLGNYWQGEIRKEVQVYYFPDCELVFYSAQTDRQRVSCIEFEAKGAASVAAALAILEKYESYFDIDAKSRENCSLFEILLADAWRDHCKARGG